MITSTTSNTSNIDFEHIDKYINSDFIKIDYIPIIVTNFNNIIDKNIEWEIRISGTSTYQKDNKILLKNNGFKWSKYNKVWYKKIDSKYVPKKIKQEFDENNKDINTCKYNTWLN